MRRLPSPVQSRPFPTVTVKRLEKLFELRGGARVRRSLANLFYTMQLPHSPLTKQDTPARTCASPVMHVPAPRPRLLAHTHTYMHNFAGRCDHPIPARTSILAGITSTTRCKTLRSAKVCRGMRSLNSAVWRTVWQGSRGCRMLLKVARYSWEQLEVAGDGVWGRTSHCGSRRARSP